MRSVFAPHLGVAVRLGGRRRPVIPAHHLKLSNVLRASLPTPPASTNFSTNADAASRNIYLNDKYGCCVIAGRYHRLGVLTAAATGKPFVATDAQIIADYTAIGGFDPKNPTQTDNGCDMATAANYGVAYGYADGSKDYGWLSVDATNKAEVMAAFWLFENLDFGMELPDAWITPFPDKDGVVWDVAGDPNPDNGHCVEGIDYNETGVIIDTWALKLPITWAAIAKYASKASNGELIVHLSPDQLAKGMAKAPNSVDWATIITYFDGLGGHVAPPVAPAPPLVPPGMIPSLAQVETWVEAALAGGHALMTRSMAKDAVIAALKNNWPH